MTTETKLVSPRQSVEVTSSSQPNPSDNTNDANTTNVANVGTTTTTNTTTIQATAAAGSTQEGVVGSAAPDAAVSRDVSFSDGSEMSLADADASDKPDDALAEASNVVTTANGENQDAVDGSKKVDSKVDTASAVTFAVTDEEKKDDKNGEKKPVHSRRDTMMALPGEEGAEDEAIVLTDLEDKFLTSVAYNKQSVVEGRYAL